MLTIKAEENFKNAIQEMGITAEDDAVVMTVRDAELLMGVGVMRLFADYAVIESICLKDEFKDFSLEYGLGKAMLNVVDLRGIRYAVSNSNDIEKQLRALKFKSPQEVQTEDLPEFIENWQLFLNLDGYFLANC